MHNYEVYFVYFLITSSIIISNLVSPMLITTLKSNSRIKITVSNTENENSLHGEDQVGPLIQYNATWESLDSRPLPSWFDESKVGIFINWGVHSVPSFGSEWFWNYWKSGNPAYIDFMKNNYPPNFTYQDFASQLTAEFYDPYEWADLFSKSGAQYVVFSSKHHEGYTLWPSKYSFSWNSMDVGPKRDLLGELAVAIRKNTTLKFGVYHSLYEWYNPLWLNDKANLLKTDDFVRFKILPEMYELVTNYEPEIIWSDGDWEAPDSYWKSKEFLMWLYNNSTVRDTVVVNDRWGSGIPCKHGGYFTCQDRYNPGVLQPFKWENAMTLDKFTWGFRRNAQLSDYLTINELLKQVAETVACGGNILVNVGPTKEGTIDPVMEERLLQLGKWLNVNGNAIYKSHPWQKAQNDSAASGVWYTRNDERKEIYGIVINGAGFYRGKEIRLESIKAKDFEKVEILGFSGKILWRDLQNKGIVIEIPDLENPVSKWAFTFVFKEQ